jgi:hypothetical protein
MNPEQEAFARSVFEHQESMAAAIGRLTSETPDYSPVQRGVEDQGTQIGSDAQTAAIARMELARHLKKLETSEILQLFSMQARKRDAGVPLDAWLGGSAPAQYGFEAMRSQLVPDTRKALDTSAVSALIRQDLEPFLYEVFVRLTPAYDRIGKEPANGLVHAWNKTTDFGDAQFMAELGTVTDDSSVFERATTNVAILATRRGISLKAAFAVPAGGMGYNPEQVELTGAMRALSFKMQRTIFGGNATDTGGTASNEFGLYDANGFTGARSVLNTARAENVDPATAPLTTGNIQRAIDAAIEEIVQTGGGMPTILWSHPTEKRTFNYQQDEKTRIIVPNQVNIGVGVQASEVNTIAGALPWAIVPGDSISNYTATSTYSGNNVRDLYIFDEGGITLPYLGSPGPTVLDIPIGISGQLTRLFIVFMMNGLAFKVPQFSNKVRVKV